MRHGVKCIRCGIRRVPGLFRGGKGGGEERRDRVQLLKNNSSCHDCATCEGILVCSGTVAGGGTWGGHAVLAVGKECPLPRWKCIYVYIYFPPF